MNQLNVGIDKLTQSEKHELASLNLIAGRKAKASAAYEGAFKYLSVSLKLLSPSSWESEYNLTLSIYEEAAEAAYLTGNFADTQWADVVLQRAKNINNPVSFISGNLSHAKQYVKDLINLVNLYQDVLPNPGQEIASEIENIELEFLIEDLLKMLDSMKLGTDRIKDIMLSLRNYSRTDGNEKKAVDIHEGINSTLIILSHRLKAKPQRPAIQIIKSYGDLPLVECFPGQLNQVFTNLIANAIDAMDESNFGKSYTEIEKNPNQIIIRTSLDNQHVKISIADNGSGMPESVINQIFNAFFTTKPEGKGTGLGLSISYEIITKKHGGKIECISSLGQGTEFIIQIPLCNGYNGCNG